MPCPEELVLGWNLQQDMRALFVSNAAMDLNDQHVGLTGGNLPGQGLYPITSIQTISYEVDSLETE